MTRAKKAPDVNSTRDSDGPVTVVLIPDEYNHEAAERVRQQFPHAQHIIEKRTTVDLDGHEVQYDVQRYLCTFQTIVEAREACRPIEKLATVRIEAPISLHEEELEILTEFHAYRALNLEWIVSIHGATGDCADFWYHRGRLDAMGRVLGQELVRRICDETTKKMGRRAAFVNHNMQAAFEQNLQQPHSGEGSVEGVTAVTKSSGLKH
jgi:hypothetical protein